VSSPVSEAVASQGLGGAQGGAIVVRFVLCLQGGNEMQAAFNTNT